MTPVPLDIGILFPSLIRPYGGERHIVQVADELAKSAEVTLYCPFAPGPFRPDSRVRVRAAAAGWRPHALRTLADWFEMPLLARRVVPHDVLLAMTYQGAFGAGIAARRLGVPWVYYCLEPPRFLYDLEDLQPAFLRGGSPLRHALRRLDRWTVAQASEILCNSDWTRDQVRAVYGRAGHVAYPGIDRDAILAVDCATARGRLGVAASTKLYLSASKLHPRKRLDQALEIFAREAGSEKGARFVILGDGPDEGRLRHVAHGLGLSNVEFRGFVAEGEKLLWMRSADVFLFTAMNEPFGLAPLEAHVAGCDVRPIRPSFPVGTPADNAAQVLKILDEVARGAAVGGAG